MLRKEVRYALAVSGIVACVVGLWACCKSYRREMTVSNLSWERWFDIEIVATCREAGWSVPEGGRIVETRERIYDYEQEYRYRWEYNYSKGEHEWRGRWEDGDPIYRDWFIYDIERWCEARRFGLVGDGLTAKWPNFIPAEGTEPNEVGKERISSRGATYTIELSDSNGTHLLTTSDESEWSSYEPGEKVVALVNVFGAVRSVEKVSQ